MAWMKSPYDHYFISSFGHSVVFEANKATRLPDNDRLIGECLKLGAVLCDETGEELSFGSKPSATKPEPKAAAPIEKDDNEGDAEAEFLVALDQALLKLLTRNDPSDLKKDLTPKVTRIVAEMSPDLRRPNATEVSEAYQRLQENIDLAE